MSLKSVLCCIKEEVKESIENRYKRKHIVELLKQIQFKDISEFLPSEHFMLSFEPLYAFKRKIQKSNHLNISNCGDEKLFKLLNFLFEEHYVGRQRLYFSDFVGVMTSRSSGKYSFSVFKEEQFNMSSSSFKFENYDSLRNNVFSIDGYGSANYIKNAIRLNWSNSLYADNIDRSHRFAALCKWDEVESRHDSELFNVNEISINEQNKKQFLENYVCFIVHMKTLSDIMIQFANVLSFYNPFDTPNSEGDIAYLIFKRVDKNDEILNVFMEEKNCIFINSLL